MIFGSNVHGCDEGPLDVAWNVVDALNAAACTTNVSDQFLIVESLCRHYLLEDRINVVEASNLHVLLIDEAVDGLDSAAAAGNHRDAASWRDHGCVAVPQA